ncbi:hypothetical protein BC830DRAFT_1080869 [Chytriomyces sp. MP71]|nr:hypothetical protein BC830DRAFT_1080869 [Chytriomyces sp. MP71]
MRTETNESSKDIWAEDEVPNDATVDPFDTRPQPEYSITYRQKVSSEDMYLQMGGKTPGFRDSDEIIVTVELPGCEFKEIELTCTKTLVDVRCPKFKLIVNLPREVRDQDGNASWNKSKQQLVVNIPIKPDF